MDKGEAEESGDGGRTLWGPAKKLLKTATTARVGRSTVSRLLSARLWKLESRLHGAITKKGKAHVNFTESKKDE